jgi:hypothetical protein
MNTYKEISEFLDLILKHKTTNKIPTDFFNEKNVILQNKYQETIIYFAAKNGILNLIPQHLLTEKNLLIKNNVSNTVFHEAAHYSHLDQIPQEFLTEKNLTQKNQQGCTAIHNACHPLGYNNCVLSLTQLPYPILVKCKKEIIEKTNIEVYTITLKVTKEKFVKELKNKIPKKLKNKQK